MTPPCRLRVPIHLQELIRGLHPDLKRKVRAALDVIRADPAAGNGLRDDLAGLRSFRLGRFRIIYRFGLRRLIDLVALGPRRVIYEETLRRLRRAAGREEAGSGLEIRHRASEPGRSRRRRRGRNV